VNSILKVATLAAAISLTVAAQSRNDIRTSLSATKDAGHRRVVGTVRLGPNGISEPLNFDVPAHTRSVTVIVEGDSRKLYALASLRTAGGTEHVNVDLSRSYGAAMEESYERQVGAMPGSLYQNIRLGTFTAVLPYLPTQIVGSGPSQVRVASNADRGDVKVTVLMPEDDGGRVLHINLIVASNQERGGRAGFLAPAQVLLDQAGIKVVVDQIRYLRRTRFNRITEWTEPQEKPDSQLARLAIEGRRVVESDALNVLVVDALPGDVYGISLGTPGPPISSNPYYGVVLRQLDSDDFQGRVFAHEVSHFLGLQHLVDFGKSGTRHYDPFPDTESGQGNLMELSGSTLTPSQKFALSRSALLQNR
jgi:hypothetical protein